MADDAAGQGVAIRIDDSVTDEEIWSVLLNKIQAPNEFLPVTDIVKRTSDDGKGTYREMTTAFQIAQGLPAEKRIIENIYAEKATLEVRFCMVDDVNEVVNAINTDAQGKRQLEYYLRNAATKERVHWTVPKKVVTGGIATVLNKARALTGTTGIFSYQSASVPRGKLSTGQCYLSRDVTGSDTPPVGLDPVHVTQHVINGRNRDLTLDKEGFQLTPHNYAHIDYLNDNSIVTTYYTEVCDLVKRITGATSVYAFDHNIRSSDTQSWMNKDGDAQADPKTIVGGNKIQSPACVVHGDYTITSAPLRLDLLAQPPKANDTWAKTTNQAPLIDPSSIDALKSKRYQFINVWRNIADEPVTDMPLGLCDASTVSAEDLVAFEIRYQDRVGENYFAGHSPRHRWFYFPLATKDEAILLKTWDSQGALCSATPSLSASSSTTAASAFPESSVAAATFSLHSAFSDPSAPKDGPKRRSIEVRTVAFFD